MLLLLRILLLQLLGLPWLRQLRRPVPTHDPGWPRQRRRQKSHRMLSWMPAAHGSRW
jgi:hypothetical protein